MQWYEYAVIAMVLLTVVSVVLMTLADIPDRRRANKAVRDFDRFVSMTPQRRSVYAH